MNWIQHLDVLMDELSVCGPKQNILRSIIKAGYSGEHRHYHNVDHIEIMLNEYHDIGCPGYQPPLIKLAILFHDICYDPFDSTVFNEGASAYVASGIVASLNMDYRGWMYFAMAEYVEGLILATYHGDDYIQYIKDHDTCIMHDIDLAILGSPWVDFNLYDQAIRREYSFLPDKVYWPARIKLLESFLNRKEIYLTTRFHEKYEQTARDNLARLIKEVPRVEGD